MSDVQSNLTSRRTVYEYLDQVVDDTILDKAFIAANNAPSHKQTNPWRFYLLGRETRTNLLPDVIELARQKAKSNGIEDFEKAEKRAVSKIMDPPVLVAVTSKVNSVDSFRENEDYAATVCALHNAILSLWDSGVGSQWSTGAITRHENTYTAIGISDDKERIIGFLKAGYPQKKDLRSKNKKELSEIRFYLP
tara:strand:+ start:2072 stop:2650 length:579 start_codon:yes stop_codon:yes gene_type:complete